MLPTKDTRTYILQRLVSTVSEAIPLLFSKGVMGADYNRLPQLVDISKMGIPNNLLLFVVQWGGV